MPTEPTLLEVATARVRALTACPITVFDDAAVVTFLNGRTYLSDPDDDESIAWDAYSASADLLDAWAARLATEIDFSADGASMSRSQKGPALRAAAKSLRRLAFRRWSERAPGDALWGPYRIPERGFGYVTRR